MHMQKIKRQSVNKLSLFFEQLAPQQWPFHTVPG